MLVYCNSDLHMSKTGTNGAEQEQKPDHTGLVGFFALLPRSSEKNIMGPLEDQQNSFIQLKSLE